MAEPLLIYTNALEQQRYADSMQQAKSELQTVIDAYDTLELEELQGNDLHRLFNDTDGLLFDKITGGEVSIQGILLDRSKAMDVIAKPEGYQELINAIKYFIEKAKSGWPLNNQTLVIYPENVSHYFILDGDGLLQFSAKSSTLLNEAGKYYANTTKAKAIYDFVKAVGEKYFELELDILWPKKGNDVIKDVIDEVLQTIDYSTRTVILDHKAVNNL